MTSPKKKVKEKAVKKTLSGLVKKGLDRREQFIEYINSYVLEASKAYYEGVQLYNLFIIESLNNDTLPEDFHTRNFIRMFLGAGHIELKTSNVKDFWLKHREVEKEGMRLNNEVFVYFASRYSTNLTNTFFMEFEKRQKKYIESWIAKKKIKTSWRVIRYEINGYTTYTKEPRPTDKKVLKFIEEERSFLGNPKNVGEFWLKDKKNFSTILKYFYRMLKYLEKSDDQKLFTIVPQASIQSHYMDITSRVLYNIVTNFYGKKILKSKGISSESKFKTNPSFSWSLFFDMKLLEKSGSFHIMTDGYGISILPKFEKKKGKSQARKSYSSDRTVIGLDPGRVTLAYAVRKKEDGTVQTHILSKKDWYVSTGIDNRIRKTNEWFKEIEKQEMYLSKISPKTTSPSRYKKFMLRYRKVKEDLWRVKTQRKVLAEKFRVYTLKQRKVDLFCNELKGNDPKDKPVIAYGSADFAPTGKGEIPGPTTWLAKQISQRVDTVFVDEFRTTIICNDCENFLHDVVTKNKEGKQVTVRGLKWCSTTLGKVTCCNLKNRDRNAALNIRKVFISENQGLGRPLKLSRDFPRPTTSFSRSLESPTR